MTAFIRFPRLAAVPLARMLGVTLVAGTLAGCGSVPDTMQVSEGTNPKVQDDLVRFRTTYYFRVFDICEDAYGNASGLPLLDTLYRFRMTGKASALFSKVHFESGVLNKNQIDPFGATVDYDKDTGRYRFVSEEETQEAARRAAERREIQYRLKLLEATEKLYAKDGSQKAALEEDNKQTAEAIRAKLRESLTTLIGALDGPRVPSAAGEAGAKAASGESDKICPAGTKLARGFQILGPEGVRTFDQDSRLILAMTSSAQPLIGSLKELSGRILNSRPGGAELSLSLVEENLSALRAQKTLDTIEADSSAELVKGVIESFEGGQ